MQRRLPGGTRWPIPEGSSAPLILFGLQFRFEDKLYGIDRFAPNAGLHRFQLQINVTDTRCAGGRPVEFDCRWIHPSRNTYPKCRHISQVSENSCPVSRIKNKLPRDSIFGSNDDRDLHRVCYESKPNYLLCLHDFIHR